MVRGLYHSNGEVATHRTWRNGRLYELLYDEYRYRLNICANADLRQVLYFEQPSLTKSTSFQVSKGAAKVSAEAHGRRCTRSTSNLNLHDFAAHLQDLNARMSTCCSRPQQRCMLQHARLSSGVVQTPPQCLTWCRHAVQFRLRKTEGGRKMRNIQCSHAR